VGQVTRARIALAALLIACAGLGAGWMLAGSPHPFSAPHRGLHAEISDRDLFGKPISTHREPLPSPAPEFKPAQTPIEPVRVRIPALQIDAKVERVSLTKDGAIDVPSNVWDTAWLATGPRPGEVGRAVIDGHKDSVQGPAIFASLGRLRPADQVLVSDRDGNELTFEVTAVAGYDLASAPLERIFGASQQRELNLITCDGSYDSRAHTYQRRLVVFTRLVS
jgi:hypothetical protein